MPLSVRFGSPSHARHRWSEPRSTSLRLVTEPLRHDPHGFWIAEAGAGPALPSLRRDLEADVVIVAPATAHLIARAATGHTPVADAAACVPSDRRDR